MVLAAVLTLAATACTGDDSGSADETTTTKALASTTSTTKPAVVRDVTDAPRTSNYEGARDDVTKVTCKQDGKTWKVGGTVTNSTKEPADYRIFTAFLDDENETRGLLQTDLTGLEAGEARPFTDDLALDAKGLTCVLRVERTVPS
jgi:hypothetical protein